MTSKPVPVTDITEKTELDASIEEVTHAVAEITAMDRTIAELTERYRSVIFDVDQPKGMQAAKEARQEIRKPRFLIEKLRKAGKAPILALGKQLDGKAKSMTERLLAIETPIDDAIKEEESRADRERQVKIEAEQRRVEGIRERIDEIRGAVAAATTFGAPLPKNVAEFISDIEKIAVDETFGEFQQQAQDAKDATLAKLRDLHRGALEREAETKRIAEERAELERLRANERRVEGIRDRIKEIRGAVDAVQSFGPPTSAKVAEFIDDVEETDVDAVYFEEFAEEAQEAKRATLTRLRELHAGAVEREQAEEKRRQKLQEQQRKIDEENERLAKERTREARRQDIRNQIHVIRGLPMQALGKPLNEQQRLIARANALGGRLSEGLTDDDSDLREEVNKAHLEAIAAIEASIAERRRADEREAAEQAEAERRRKADAAAKKARYPGDQALVDALVERFEITAEVAQKWLRRYGKKAKAA